MRPFCATGCRSCPLSKTLLEWGVARFYNACIGGPKVRRTGACKVGPGEAGIVDLYRCSSTAPLVDLQRRLMSIIGMLRKAEGTFSLFKCEISVQWTAVVS